RETYLSEKAQLGKLANYTSAKQPWENPFEELLLRGKRKGDRDAEEEGDHDAHNEDQQEHDSSGRVSRPPIRLAERYSLSRYHNAEHEEEAATVDP
ncbi:unnamed protein product, partial [Amoebophrya sp. A25]